MLGSVREATRLMLGCVREAARLRPIMLVCVGRPGGATLSITTSAITTTSGRGCGSDGK